MKEGKAILVTVAMAAMLVIILVCLFLLKSWIMFFIICGMLAIAGLAITARNFCSWLSIPDDADDPDVPEPVIGEPVDEPDPVPSIVTGTVDEIMKEVRKS